MGLAGVWAAAAPLGVPSGKTGRHPSGADGDPRRSYPGRAPTPLLGSPDRRQHASDPARRVFTRSGRHQRAASGACEGVRVRARLGCLMSNLEIPGVHLGVSGCLRGSLGRPGGSSGRPGHLSGMSSYSPPRRALGTGPVLVFFAPAGFGPVPVCACAHVCVYACACTCVHVCTHVCARVCTCVHVCACVHVCTCVCMCMHVCVYVCARVRLHACVHM